MADFSGKHTVDILDLPKGRSWGLSLSSRFGTRNIQAISSMDYPPYDVSVVPVGAMELLIVPQTTAGIYALDKMVGLSRSRASVAGGVTFNTPTPLSNALVYGRVARYTTPPGWVTENTYAEYPYEHAIARQLAVFLTYMRSYLRNSAGWKIRKSPIFIDDVWGFQDDILEALAMKSKDFWAPEEEYPYRLKQRL